MPHTAPPAHVRAAFAVSGAVRYHHGNFGGVWSDGAVVLKSVTNVTETTAMAELFEQLEVPGVRIPKPLRSLDGAFVVDGWAATTHLDGRRLSGGRWTDRVMASRALCRALEDVPRPTFFDTLDHMWARGARIAWGELDWTPPEQWKAVAADLREAAGSVSPPKQLIHGDIAGNILTAPHQPLGVVDFSPTWESALWSECMVVTDGLLWFNAPDDTVDALVDDEAGPMLCRTTLFRLVVHCLWFGATPPTDVDDYRRVTDLVISL